MKPPSVFAVAVSFFVLCRYGLAENIETNDPAVILDPVVVSASKIPTRFEEVTSAVTVITRDEINRMNPASVAGLLQSAPGVYVDRQGSRGGLSSVYIRGADPNYTVILVDGVKMNDPTNARGGSFDVSAISLSNIERIEIVRGPVASVYGSDAMAGAVNIITVKGKAQREFSVETGAGSFGDYQGSAMALGSVSEYAGYALTASYADNGEWVKGDAYTGGDVYMKIDMYPGESTDVGALLRFHGNHSESFPDDSGGSEYAVFRETDKRDTRELTLGVSLLQHLSENAEVQMSGTWLDRKEDFDSPGVAPGIRNPAGIPPNASDSRFGRGQLSAKILTSPNRVFNATVGIDAELETGRSDFTIKTQGSSLEDRFDSNRYMYSPFFEAQFLSGVGLTLTGAVRVDIPDGFDAELSPRIGALYRFGETSTTLKANWGKGFKLPSFFSISNPIVGNPELEPETSEGYDLTLSQELFDRKFQADITAFYNKFNNLIDLNAGPPPQLINRKEVDTKGVELAMAIQAHKRVKLGLNATYVKTDIKNSDEKLLNSPEWVAGAGVDWNPTAHWNFNLSGNYVSEKEGSSIPTGDVDLDAYFCFNAALVWRPKTTTALTFAVDNIFNEKYEEAVGFVSNGTHYRIGAKFQF